MSNISVPDPVIYYAEKLKQHGVRPAAVDVTREGQQLRFEILLDALGDTNQSKLLDVGCGYGAFAEFLEGGAFLDLAPGAFDGLFEEFTGASEFEELPAC